RQRRARPRPGGNHPGEMTMWEKLDERRLKSIVEAVGFPRRARARLVLRWCALARALRLPLAGSYGLWDPWETHYSEVARQMTTRGDFISLWWPASPRETAVVQTKPVLFYWLMSIAMLVG